MTRKQIMNWMFDHPLTTTTIISIPVFFTVVWIGLKTHII